MPLLSWACVYNKNANFRLPFREVYGVGDFFVELLMLNNSTIHRFDTYIFDCLDIVNQESARTADFSLASFIKNVTVRFFLSLINVSYV